MDPDQTAPTFIVIGALIVNTYQAGFIYVLHLNSNQIGLPNSSHKHECTSPV